MQEKIRPGQLIPHNPKEDATRRKYIDTANKIIIGDISFDEGVLRMGDNHAEYRLRKLIKGDFYLAGYNDLDYDYIRHKWAVRKEFYKEGWYKTMHPFYKRMFPDVKPKKLGRGGMITFINKDGSSKSISIQNLRQPMGWVVWNEALDSDFTLDKIQFADAYNKVQYWDILRHNRAVDVQLSKVSQIMDALLTGISVNLGAISLSSSLSRMGFRLLKTADSAISKVRVTMLRYRLNRMRAKVIPRNEFEKKKIKEYSATFSKKAVPLRTDVHPLERKLIRTQHKSVNVRINRKRKIVTRVRYKGAPGDPPPALKDI